MGPSIRMWMGWGWGWDPSESFQTHTHTHTHAYLLATASAVRTLTSMSLSAYSYCLVWFCYHSPQLSGSDSDDVQVTLQVDKATPVGSLACLQPRQKHTHTHTHTHTATIAMFIAGFGPALASSSRDFKHYWGRSITTSATTRTVDPQQCSGLPRSSPHSFACLPMHTNGLRGSGRERHFCS